jgi:methyl-accepting chemotaxis protein
MNMPARLTAMAEESVAPASAILEAHLRRDGAIDATLNQVVGDTEDSALAIMKQVRLLHETASKLIAYLNGSGSTAGDLGIQILASVTHLVDIGAFIEELPAKMDRDLLGVKQVVEEINSLNGMVQAIQLISTQSHILSLNAAIEAARAGSAGAPFQILAGEMRRLASDSKALGTNITKGLARASLVVEGSLAASIADSTKQFARVSDATASIQKVRDNFEDMSQFYKTRFAAATRHNEELATEIAEVLGQVQYQDVVRQAIERIRATIGQRNASLQNALAAPGSGTARAQLPEQLELILNDYVTNESKHRLSTRAASEGATELKVELF